MDTAVQLTPDFVNALKAFHEQNFPGQKVPHVEPTKRTAQDDPQDLGFYRDGVRRTLTDEQIAIFRHSEIQRLLAQRKRLRELEQGRTTAREGKDFNLRLPWPSRPSHNTDAAMHTKPAPVQLSYDEETQVKPQQPAAFQWPKLG